MNTKQHKLKTFKKVQDVPMLHITQTDLQYSPRETEENICIILIKGNRGDRNQKLNQYLKEQSQLAESAEDHLNRMKQKVEEFYESPVVYANYLKEHRHGGSIFSEGQHRGWDYSNNGFIFITQKSLDTFGVTETDIPNIVELELHELNCWLNGEVYEFYLYDDKGNQVDQCSDIYGLENIKAYLTEDWQQEDLTKYIVHD